MRTALSILALVLLGCAPVIQIPPINVRIVQERITPTAVRVDTMFFLTRLDLILDIYEVRNVIINSLTQDLERILKDHFILDDVYDTADGFLINKRRWDGDWINWIQLKMKVLMRASGQRISMTLKWRWEEMPPHWKLYEVTHKEE